MCDRSGKKGKFTRSMGRLSWWWLTKPSMLESQSATNDQKAYQGWFPFLESHDWSKAVSATDRVPRHQNRKKKLHPRRKREKHSHAQAPPHFEATVIWHISKDIRSTLFCIVCLSVAALALPPVEDRLSDWLANESWQERRYPETPPSSWWKMISLISFLFSSSSLFTWLIWQRLRGWSGRGGCGSHDSQENKLRGKVLWGTHKYWRLSFFFRDQAKLVFCYDRCCCCCCFFGEKQSGLMLMRTEKHVSSWEETLTAWAVVYDNVRFLCRHPNISCH